MASSYVSLRPRPDLPARFESLNDDTLTTTLEFVGDKSYATYAGINKHCKEVYVTSRMTKETFIYGYAPLSRITDKIERASHDWKLYERVGKGVVFFNRRDILDWVLQQRNKYVLKRICIIAAEEDRLDILDEVWNNVDNKRDIFSRVDRSAARFGKLNVLKWLETKGLLIDEKECADAAAEGGQLHILQWLKEERGLKLKSGLYNDAIEGDGQLHVMKWLREQGCPWSKRTFRRTAKKGNLAIFQWLHDEGCPWSDDLRHRIHESRLKPEVIDWCRVNGYGNRLYND